MRAFCGRFGRAAVTGGAGFIGRRLVCALEDAGLSVVSLDIRPHDFPAPSTGVITRAVDLRDPAAAAAALDGVDVVFHLAGNASGTVSVQDPRRDFEANALVGFNVLEAMRSRPATKLVYQSSAMVYGVPARPVSKESDPCRPFYPYGASKLAVEYWMRAYVKTFGIDASAARAFVVYGPGDDPRQAGGEVNQFLRWHLNHMPVVVTGDPERKVRDFVHVDDVVAGLVAIAASGSPGAAYNLGSGSPTSLRQLLEAIHAVTGRPVEARVDDSDLTDTYSLVADLAETSLLGYAPRVRLAEGIERLVRELGPRPEPPSLPTVLSSRGFATLSNHPSAHAHGVGA
jgi:UDP-glucose 4-epimerase